MTQTLTGPTFRTRFRTRSFAVALALALYPTAVWAQDAASNPAPASEADSAGLTLKENVMVNDEVVRLGDLFAEPISNGDAPIAQAPNPGQTIVLDNRVLRSVARAYGLDWQPASKYQRVLVGRVSHRIDGAAVLSQVKDAVRAHLGIENDVDLAFDGGEVEFVLPTSVEPTMAIQDIRFDPASQRFAALLVVPAEGPTVISRKIAGSIYETLQIPVLGRAIAPGEVIQIGDIDWQSLRLDRVAPNAITDPKQLIGMTAKRPLRTGQTLRQSDVTMAATIKKNAVVTLSVQTDNMSLTTPGRALEDGAIGQPIRVVNTASNKQLTGIVTDAGTVTITVSGKLALN
jgi:flagella basal body P-ring formation protein FlgA